MAGIYFAQTICSLCVLSKESCIQKGLVGIYLYLADDPSSLVVLIISGQRYLYSLMIWIYFALIFQCLHLILVKAVQVRSLAFSALI